MAGVDSVNQSLFFQASAIAASQSARQNQLKKNEKTASAKKSNFRASVEKAEEEATLIAEGLPVEIAGLGEEEALVFLKDQMDIAGDELKAKQGMEAIEKYRQKVSQFLRYVVRNNYEVIQHKRKGWDLKRKRPVAPYQEVQVINKKLEQLTNDILYNHADKLKILKAVDELNGLIVNLLQ